MVRYAIVCPPISIRRHQWYIRNVCWEVVDVRCRCIVHLVLIGRECGDGYFSPIFLALLGQTYINGLDLPRLPLVKYDTGLIHWIDIGIVWNSAMELCRWLRNLSRFMYWPFFMTVVNSIESNKLREQTIVQVRAEGTSVTYQPSRSFYCLQVWGKVKSKYNMRIVSFPSWTDCK